MLLWTIYEQIVELIFRIRPSMKVVCLALEPCSSGELYATLHQAHLLRARFCFGMERALFTVNFGVAPLEAIRYGEFSRE